MDYDWTIIYLKRIEGRWNVLNIILDIIIGVISFVIAAFLKWLWDNHLSYILNDLFSKNPIKLAESWKTTFREDNNNYSEEVKLKQKGIQISGEIEFRDSDKKDKKNIYTFEGTFINLILTATYYAIDPSDFERGTFTLRYEQEGMFKGKSAFFSKESPRKIVSSDYIWKVLKLS